MAQRFLSRLRHTLRSGDRATHEVHFHSGPEGQPAPCFDARCSSPRLDPRAHSALLFP